MVAGRNPDIDPTRTQPYGNPHARREGVGVSEPEAVQDLRAEAAKAMSNEGESAEEVKSKGRRSRRVAPRGEDGKALKHLTGHPNEYVDGSRIVDQSGRQLAVLASAPTEEIGMPVRIVEDTTKEPKAKEPTTEPSDRESTPPGGTPEEVVEAGTPNSEGEPEGEGDQSDEPGVP